MKIVSDSESYGDMVLETLEDWYKLLETSTLKNYEVDKKRDKKWTPEELWAFAVFRHGDTVKDALKRGDSERAAYYMMLATHCVMRIEMSERLDKFLGIAKDGLQDDLKLVAPLLESAAKQQAGLAVYNQYRSEKKKIDAAKARELRAQDWKYEAIAAELGISTKTVSRYLKE